MRPIIYPYKMGSKSARELAAQLRDVRGKRVRERGNYRPYRNHLIINWGNPRLPTWWQSPDGRIDLKYINHPTNVTRAQNKLITYQLLQRVERLNIPEFTEDYLTAAEWYRNDIPLLKRTVMNGHGGVGIYYMHGENIFQGGPGLYVKYMKKRDEYRVHVFRGEIIDIQQKRRRRDYGGEVDNKIRNYQRGWVFCRNEITPPNEQILEQAKLAVEGLGLDFGAVDIGWNQHHQTATVYEVNTAPGLEGTTLSNYVNVIRRLL